MAQRTLLIFVFILFGFVHFSSLAPLTSWAGSSAAEEFARQLEDETVQKKVKDIEAVHADRFFPDAPSEEDIEIENAIANLKGKSANKINKAVKKIPNDRQLGTNLRHGDGVYARSALGICAARCG